MTNQVTPLDERVIACFSNFLVVLQEKMRIKGSLMVEETIIFGSIRDKGFGGERVPS